MLSLQGHPEKGFMHLTSCSPSLITSCWPLSNDCTRQKEKPLAVRGWEQFLRLMGIKNLSVAAGGGTTPSVSFYSSVSFEHQPQWLWCENKLISKPQLEISWLCLSIVYPPTQRRNCGTLSVLQRAACITHSSRESFKRAPGLFRPFPP